MQLVSITIKLTIIIDSVNSVFNNTEYTEKPECTCMLEWT